ncbi:hypothetical protein [Myxococcus phage Mx4 ts27htf-1hrm-1]|nr:hypothetical protein [Myxococcus phage Mx4 ts27htf-1hrm-1]
MPASPSWQESPETWDRLVIAGETFSGPVEVDFEVGRKRDVKSTPGLDGATLTDTGRAPCEITIRLELWLKEHWDFVTRVLVPLVRPPLPAAPSGKSPTAATGNGIPENFFVRTEYTTAAEYTAALQQELLVNQPAQAMAEGQGLLVTDTTSPAVRQADTARKRALAPVQVYYPSLAGYGIRLLQLHRLSAPKRIRPGVMAVTLTGAEYSAKRAAGVTTATASAPDSGLSRINLAPELRGRAAPPSSTSNRP